ncbi:MAG: glycosyltransferase [Bacteroidota bacterium]
MPRKQKTALVAPLNWGLGHASRLLPLIRTLGEMNYEVHIAGSSPANDVISQEFPGIRILPLKSATIKYSRNRLLMIKLFFQAPFLLRDLLYERRWIRKYVKQEKPDLIISDNRFGLSHPKVMSCYITHQVNVIMPEYLKIFQALARVIHRSIIKKYDICMIPDFSQNPLSGKLAHNVDGFDFRHIYLGILSGFFNTQPVVTDNVPDVLAIVSGQEPQRSMLVEQLMKLFAGDKRNLWIIAGQPEARYDFADGNVRVINHLRRAELKYLMQHTPVLITRSGYTTLMDLHVLQRKAILIPTPGQTEQEYLAEYFSDTYDFQTIQQKDLADVDYFQPEFCGDWLHTERQNASSLHEKLSATIRNAMK